MSKFKIWAQREYGRRHRAFALFGLGILFVVAVPLCLILVVPLIDRSLNLSDFHHGTINIATGIVLVVIGLLFSLWSIHVQFTVGHGTPAPMIPTQKLIIRKPYSYCRNPMSLGTILLYLGIAIWIGSPSAFGLTLILAVFLATYNKLIEERELEERFCAEYLKYKQRTPFLLPRPRKGGWWGRQLPWFRTPSSSLVRRAVGNPRRMAEIDSCTARPCMCVSLLSHLSHIPVYVGAHKNVGDQPWSIGDVAPVP